MDFSGYLRQARALPPQVVLRKAVGLARRTGGSWAQLASDALGGSYGAARPAINPAACIVIAADDVPADLEATLRRLAPEYLAHRLDLLGSGWVSPVYGLSANGFLGHRYAPAGPAAPDRAGHGLEAIVNRSNLAPSRRIWRMIARENYTPIDWQLDVRSGYRWSAQRPSLRLPIPVDMGADVKMPWELGRLQHLPQLALCAILAAAGRQGFDAPARYAGEIADQLADFIAANPPRFGVNWMGAMDVGIRAANIALTLALLRGAGFELTPDLQETVAGALNDHAEHVVTHLEYSESGRSNHYLANLGGVLWASWALTGEDAERRLIFAIAEVLKEADHQFLADGGNYEGSTSYHRLSAEIVLFSLAVIVSLDDAALARLERVPPSRLAWRAQLPKLPLARAGKGQGGAGLVPAVVLRKLMGAAELSRAVQGADGTIVQIGDTDSGRFFKLHPTALPGLSDPFTENTLDHRGFIDAVDVRFGAPPQTMDGVLLRKLAGSIERPASAPPLADFGVLDGLIARWQATPEASRRVRRLPFNVPVERWARAAYPDFGLYVFRHDAALIAFRCGGEPPKGAPRGHRHDDNLGLEYRLGPAERRDPGSFVYTPSVAERNRHRSAMAHDVARAQGQPLAKLSADLFHLEISAYARCLCWRPDGVAGEVTGPAGTVVLRIVKLSATEMTVYDCVTPPAVLADIAPPLPVSFGYGRH